MENLTQNMLHTYCDGDAGSSNNGLKRKRSLSQDEHRPITSEDGDYRSNDKKTRNPRAVTTDEVSGKENKAVFEISVALDILKDADPVFVEDTWAASGKHIHEFYRRIFTALQHNSYPRKSTEQHVEIEAPETNVAFVIVKQAPSLQLASHPEQGSHISSYVNETDRLADTKGGTGFDISVALEILKDADPEFVENTWLASGKHIQEFNLRIFNALQHNNYPRKNTKRHADIEPPATTIEFVTLEQTPSLQPASHPEQAAQISSIVGETIRLEVEGAEGSFDNSVALDILKEADPVFIEDTWVASGKHIQEFNRRIYNAFKHNSYPRKIKHQEISHQQQSPLTKVGSDWLEENQTFQTLDPQKTVFIECQCCYDNVSCINTVECSKYLHNFCYDCVKKCCEVGLGNGQLVVKCMAECAGIITDNALEAALPADLFENMQKSRQRGEIHEAKLDDLQYCPFCDYAYITTANDKEFVCINEKCMKSSCLTCKKLSHLPNPCEERAVDTELRKKLEEGMTEALIRKCYKCGKSYLKSSGCNMISCSCGAIMCYICQKPIRGHQHFDRPRSSSNCPLYSDDRALHVLPVLNASQTIHKQIMLSNPSARLTVPEIPTPKPKKMRYTNIRRRGRRH